MPSQRRPRGAFASSGRSLRFWAFRCSYRAVGTLRNFDALANCNSSSAIRFVRSLICSACLAIMSSLFDMPGLYHRSKLDHGLTRERYNYPGFIYHCSLNDHRARSTKASKSVRNLCLFGLRGRAVRNCFCSISREIERRRSTDTSSSDLPHRGRTPTSLPSW